MRRYLLKERGFFSLLFLLAFFIGRFGTKKSNFTEKFHQYRKRNLVSHMI